MSEGPVTNQWQSALRSYSLGLTSLSEGRYKEAIHHLSLAIKLGYRTVSACCELGLTRFELVQIQPAEERDDPRKSFYPASWYLWGVDIGHALEYLNIYKYIPQA